MCESNLAGAASALVQMLRASERTSSGSVGADKRPVFFLLPAIHCHRHIVQSSVCSCASMRGRPELCVFFHPPLPPSPRRINNLSFNNSIWEVYGPPSRGRENRFHLAFFNRTMCLISEFAYRPFGRIGPVRALGVGMLGLGVGMLGCLQGSRDVGMSARQPNHSDRKKAGCRFSLQERQSLYHLWD